MLQFRFENDSRSLITHPEDREATLFVLGRLARRLEAYLQEKRALLDFLNLPTYSSGGQEGFLGNMRLFVGHAHAFELATAFMNTAFEELGWAQDRALSFVWFLRINGFEGWHDESE